MSVDSKTICQPSRVAAEFNKHVSKCDQCLKSVRVVADDLDQPLELCEEGRKLMYDMFN